MHSPHTATAAISAVFLLALVPIIHAGGYDSAIGSVMKYCLNENESFTKERLGATDYYLVSVGKFEAGLGSTYTVQDSFVILVDSMNASRISIVSRGP